VNPVKEVADIGFDLDNTDGVEPGKILEKSVCSNEKLKEYVIVKWKQFLKKPLT
jgi:hypothetical protein